MIGGLLVVACGSALSAPAGAPERVAVLLEDATAADISRAAAIVGAQVTHVLPDVGFAVVETTDVALFADVLGAPVHLDVEGHGGLVPVDPLWSTQWGPQALDMPTAWDIETGSTYVTVAIVDSGFDFDHPDFTGVPVVAGTDWVQKDLMPQDANGHGTHVAGIVAAAHDDVGIAGMAQVQLLIIRVLNAQNAGSCLDFALGIVEASTRLADVINLSLYCSAGFAPLRQATQYAVARGSVVVSIAGNFQQSDPNACPTLPGAYPGVIAVAALQSNLAAAPYSCHGATNALAAPGSSIRSTVPGGWSYFSGTSMAAPHVAATAALLKSQDPLLTNVDIRAKLESTALDLGAAGKDDVYGWGMVRPALALT